MGAMKQQLEWQQIMQEVELREAELGRAKAELVEARWQAERLAGAVCRGEAFSDWLLMQDASSAVSFSPARKRKMIEEKTDLELALEFIASTAAG